MDPGSVRESEELAEFEPGIPLMGPRELSEVVLANDELPASQNESQVTL